ncbi:hypothetical protein [Sinimarinibacterium flocculans]|uniref:hypothetical protein n=1 Tax=Sinimarinibacterium flocculans TaxID=985250 RepID=UPI0024909D22|nr:hypothetical protein [Sinimarinibacterium flocculans]
MNAISPEVAVAIAIAVVVALSLFGRKRQPKERTFKCSRCSAVSAHTPRTIEAWRAGKTKFFCNSCHGQWLRSQPQQPRPDYSSRAGKSGCLGVMALFIALPVLAVSAWWVYA